MVGADPQILQAFRVDDDHNEDCDLLDGVRDCEIQIVLDGEEIGCGFDCGYGCEDFDCGYVFEKEESNCEIFLDDDGEEENEIETGCDVYDGDRLDVVVVEGNATWIAENEIVTTDHLDDSSYYVDYYSPQKYDDEDPNHCHCCGEHHPPYHPSWHHPFEEAARTAFLFLLIRYRYNSKTILN